MMNNNMTLRIQGRFNQSPGNEENVVCRVYVVCCVDTYCILCDSVILPSSDNLGDQTSIAAIVLNSSPNTINIDPLCT
jgi:hypothetical protein